MTETTADEQPHIDCRECDGKGFGQLLTDPDTGKAYDSDPCPHCNGYGWTYRDGSTPSVPS